MSTRCLIGMVNAKNEVEVIRCQHDGYYEGVGETLYKNYQDKKTVEELMKLGNISELDDTIESTKSERYDEYMEPFTNKDEFFYSLNNDEHYKIFIEYAYLYDDGVWYVLKNLGEKSYDRLDTIFNK